MQTARDPEYVDRRIDLKRPLDLLIVDDDEICMLLQRRVARASGFFNGIRSAKNGKAAMAILEDAGKGKVPRPDVIFLDLNMPVMNGLEFLKAFNELNWKSRAGISIVMLSSSTREKDKADSASMGADHYLIKPLDLPQTKMVVSSIAGTWPTPPPVAGKNCKEVIRHVVTTTK